MTIIIDFICFDFRQKEKCANRRICILGIIKTHCNVVKTRPSYVECGNINAIAMSSSRIYDSFHFLICLLLVVKY